MIRVANHWQPLARILLLFLAREDYFCIEEYSEHMWLGPFVEA
jgi:hypothetical protein